ncbi:MAG: hypothetical protein WBV66_23195, partial [Pseudolabrys sp.]
DGDAGDTENCGLASVSVMLRFCRCPVASKTSSTEYEDEGHSGPKLRGRHRLNKNLDATHFIHIPLFYVPENTVHYDVNVPRLCELGRPRPEPPSRGIATIIEKRSCRNVYLAQSPKRGSFGSRSLDAQESPRNAGNTLAEADGTEREIMARLGHKSPQMAAHYTKRASQKKLARSAVEKIERAKIARG